MRPLLEVLKENGEMYRHDAIDAVVKKMNLTQEQLAEKQISNGLIKIFLVERNNCFAE